MGWVFFFPKHSERHVGAVDFHQKIAEILTVDSRNFKFQKISCNQEVEEDRTCGMEGVG